MNNYLSYGDYTGKYFIKDEDYSSVKNYDFNTVINDSSFDKNNSYIAVATNNEVIIINTSDWSINNTINITTENQTVDFDPNGNYLAVGNNDDNDIKIINTSDWSINTTIQLSNNYKNEVKFSPNGNYLAIAPRESKAYVVSTSDWNLIAEITDPTDFVFGIDFNPNSNYLAVGDGNGNTFIINTSDWSLDTTITSNSVIDDLEFDPNNNYLAISVGGNVQIKDLSWQQVNEITYATSTIETLSFSSTTDYLAIGSNDTNVYVVNRSDWSLDKTFNDPNDFVYSVNFIDKEISDVIVETTKSEDIGLNSADLVGTIQKFDIDHDIVNIGFQYRKKGNTTWNRYDVFSININNVSIPYEFKSSLNNIEGSENYEYRAFVELE